MFSIYNHNGQWFLRIGWLAKPVKSFHHGVKLVKVYGLASTLNKHEVN